MCLFVLCDIFRCLFVLCDIFRKSDPEKAQARRKFPGRADRPLLRESEQAPITN